MQDAVACHVNRANRFRRMPLAAALISFAVVVALVPAVARAASPPSGVDVFVGYADTLHANPANFPTPWAGSPNVTFDGCPDGVNCDFDTSAVRVVNNTPVAHTFSVALKFDTCAINIWSSHTIQPGGELIVAQQNHNNAPGCDPQDGEADGSDIGLNSTNVQGTCTQSGLIPEVDLTVDGTAFNEADTGQVLNTGGVDKAACGGGPILNESEQWTLLGTQPCSSAVLSLAPASQSHVLGATATVQASLTNSCGQPLQNVAVNFAVTSGPNAGVTGTGTTNSSGLASFSYTSSTPGTDTLVASITNPAGTLTSNSVQVIWLSPIMTGRAYGLSASVNALLLGLNIPPIPDTGYISTTSTTSTTPPCVINLTGIVSAGVLCASNQTDAVSLSSTSTATAATVTVGIPGVPVIKVVAAKSTSTTTCAGSTGSTTIVGLTVGGIVVNVNNLHPNTGINIGLVGLVLNEQTPVPGGLTVNAVHITVNALVVNANIVISSATSDIHNCPPTS